MPEDALDQKSDAWLVAALLSEDENDSATAAHAIVEMHGPDLLRYLNRKLPKDWAEQGLAEVWLAFFETLQRSGLKTTIGQLLGGIAQKRRADLVDQLTRERRFEADLPYELAGAADVELSVEDEEIENYRVGVAYGESVLTSCEQMLWALAVQYGFSNDVISRIVGKSRDTLNTHFSNAHQKVKAQIRAADYAPPTWRANPFPVKDRPDTERAVIIENFESWFLPSLTPEEIKPLGMPAAELQRDYSALLIVPRWQGPEAHETAYGNLSLLLVRQDAQAAWRKQVGRIRRHPDAKRYRFPEACLVNLDVDNGYLHLEVQTLAELWPDLDAPAVSDRTFLALHNVPVLVPVMLGAWDPDLYLDPDLNHGGTAYDRWPFLPAADSWT
jgi:DNA-directed RNA polymerase specialized sigma24 family protein